MVPEQPIISNTFVLYKSQAIYNSLPRSKNLELSFCFSHLLIKPSLAYKNAKVFTEIITELAKLHVRSTFSSPDLL